MSNLTRRPSLIASLRGRPSFNQLPPAALRLSLLTFLVATVIMLLALVVGVFSVYGFFSPPGPAPLILLPLGTALTLNLGCSLLFSLYSIGVGDGGEPAMLRQRFSTPAFVVGGVGLVVAVYAAVQVVGLIT